MRRPSLLVPALLFGLSLPACTSGGPPPAQRARVDVPEAGVHTEVLSHDLLRHALESFRAGNVRVDLPPGSAAARPVPDPDPGPPDPVVATSRVQVVPPFDSLLPSWNVELQGPDAAFRFEARVGRAADGSWSPWLSFGGWGAGAVRPSQPEVVRFAEGRVAVDVLQAAPGVRWDRLQWRVRRLGPAGVEVREVALCRADRDALERHPRVGWPAHDVRVDLPVRSQRLEAAELAPRICSPTSVAMLLALHGADHPTAEVAATLYDAEHDIYGNWNRAVQGAYLLGARGHLERMADWARVVELLRAGVPVIASIAAEQGQLDGAPYPRTSGHLLVVRGLTADGRVLVHDPAAPDLDTVPRAYDRRQFEAVWFAHGGVAYVIEGPAGS